MAAFNTPHSSLLSNFWVMQYEDLVNLGNLQSANRNISILCNAEDLQRIRPIPPKADLVIGDHPDSPGLIKDLAQSKEKSQSVPRHVTRDSV